MKKGIKILEETIGDGILVQKGDKISVRYTLCLNKGDVIQNNFETEMILGNRNIIAGLNYGIEGMREGGKRKFRASPHLCYKDEGITDIIPPSSVLVFTLELLKILKK